MILIVIGAVLYCLVAPTALTLGGVLAAVLGVLSLIVSLGAAGPGAFLTARLTASPRSLVRAVGWVGLSSAVVTAVAAFSGTVLCGVIVAAAAGLAPEWGCGAL